MNVNKNSNVNHAKQKYWIFIDIFMKFDCTNKLEEEFVDVIVELNDWVAVKVARFSGNEISMKTIIVKNRTSIDKIKNKIAVYELVGLSIINHSFSLKTKNQSQPEFWSIITRYSNIYRLDRQHRL